MEGVEVEPSAKRQRRSHTSTTRRSQTIDQKADSDTEYVPVVAIESDTKKKVLRKSGRARGRPVVYNTGVDASVVALPSTEVEAVLPKESILIQTPSRPTIAEETRSRPGEQVSCFDSFHKSITLTISRTKTLPVPVMVI